MSLLSWLIEEVKKWVEPFVRGIIDPIIKGAQNAVKFVSDGLSALQSAWTNFTSKTLPDLWKAIENASVSFVENIENIANYTVEKIENTYNYVTQEIHNVYHTTEQYITQEIGASQEWVETVFGVNLRKGIEEWVQKYVVSAFNDLIGAWIGGILKDFQEGFEEGLKEAQES